MLKSFTFRQMQVIDIITYAGVALQYRWYAREAAVLERDWHGAAASSAQYSALASVVVPGCQA